MDGDTALSDKLDALVRAYDDTYELKDKQREALLFLAGKKGDLIVNLPVGYGKSIIYHILPKILGENVTRPVVLVISPLNVIQKDQRAELRRRNITCCRLSISATVEEDSDSCERFTCSADQGVEQLVNGDFSVVLSHPEAILNTEKGREILNSKLQSHVVAVVIDECHILDKWVEEFRTAFKELKSLKAFFPEVPFVALSGTLTCEQKMILPKELSLINHAVIECSPDKPNIFLEKIDKGKTTDVEGEYEEVTHRICDQLFLEKEKFPVTLLFLPVKYMSQVLMYLNSLFKPSCIDDSIYSAICSGQDQYVIEKTVQELKKSDPRIRLVLTTSILGMGFDPENVCQIVHACPPRNISQYFQEIGRAGRRNQSAIATLHYNSRNIAKNLPGMNDDMISYCKNDSSCLRNNLLSVFGFTKASDIKGCKCCSFCKRICTCGTCFTSNGLSLDS